MQRRLIGASPENMMKLLDISFGLGLVPRRLLSAAVGFGLISGTPRLMADPQIKTEHVVVMVWDGLRPDSVNEQNTPTLASLARRGVTFANHHSVFPTSTEVNGAALGTGDFPEHDGLIGNIEYRPAINSKKPIATEDVDAVRRGDQLTSGKYLTSETIAELLQGKHRRTAIAGTKPVALLLDRREREAEKGSAASATVFTGNTLPGSLSETLGKMLKPFPQKTFPNRAQDG